MFSIGAFAIIFNENGQVLLSHRRDMDAWNLPGGGLESRELPSEAVIREVEEETGLEVEIERLVGVYGKVDKDELVFAFVCRIVGGNFILTDETDQHGFFSVNEFPSNTLSKHVERVQDALQASNQPIFRHQTSPSAKSIFGQSSTPRQM